jgi:spore germination protein GerM
VTAGGRVKKDNSIWYWIGAGIIIAVVLGVGAYMFFRDVREPSGSPTTEFQAMTGYTGPRVAVTLYFPSRDGKYLNAETRQVRSATDRIVQAREVVEELIRGPRTGLTPSFPAGARVKGIFVDDKGTAYINFSTELQTEYPGGAWTETLTIYSLTNTLTEDFPEIKSVQILVEGSQIPTLAGHIDTTRPFSPRPALNK